MGKFKTEQEQFWAGGFGDNYIERNVGKNLIASNIAFFAKVLKNTTKIKTVLEFGSNIGLNIIALETLLPNAGMAAIEINRNAVKELKKNCKKIQVYPMSIFDFEPDKKRDFCGEMMDKFNNLKIVDYGFVYHRDTNFPNDDITWFLLEKV
ncbi:MAG: pseudaminic acid biosynthesis-associated methylase [Bacteroidetes bacterium]|nr:pseudaminic acid biosynthesis-associated methylase [Bacteroidota bacterium]